MAEETVIEIPEGKDAIPQPYHLVNPSPWPILSSFAGGFFALCMIFWMHSIEFGSFAPGAWWALIGTLPVLACMFGWWRDVIHESVVEKAHSGVVKIGMRYGMVLFIASEVMFFVAFFWAYFNASLFPVGGVWPPEGIKTFDPFDLPLMMTMILLLSGTTCTWAHHAILEGRNKEAAQALAVTVGLGILFSGFQAYEYSKAAWGLSDGIYPSTFFLATGFHGFHVLIGTAFLAVCWWRTVKGHFTRDSHFGFEAAAWYWHFVDVVWLFLFVAIYWWGA